MPTTKSTGLLGKPSNYVLGHPSVRAKLERDGECTVSCYDPPHGPVRYTWSNPAAKNGKRRHAQSVRYIIRVRLRR